jgi:two-component system NtrC family sensor kinase
VEPSETALLNALARLAGGIAHEINNPLSFITTNLHFVLELLKGPAPLSASREDLVSAATDALVGAERIAQIVKDVRIFSHVEAAPLSEVGLTACVANAIERASPTGARRLRVELSAGSSVLASEEGLRQVLFELISNAAQALPTEIRIHTESEPDGRIRIDVSDDGEGIAPENLPHIFQPFFTTRRIGAGAGLGLCICYGVVRRMGGEIRVASEPGKGATFSVFLRSASSDKSGIGVSSDAVSTTD